jgi:hypothetical protein
VTADYAVVIRSLNERFGTSFREFEHTPENVRACFEAMEGYWADREGPGLPLVGRTRSTDTPQTARAPLEEEYRAARLSRLRARAASLRAALLGP